MTNTVDSQRDNRMAWALRRVQAPEPEIDSMVEALKGGTKAHVAKVESLFTHSQVWEGFTAHAHPQPGSPVPRQEAGEGNRMYATSTLFDAKSLPGERPWPLGVC